MHEQQPTIVCPHCDYRFDREDIESLDIDCETLAAIEAVADIQCVRCEQEFVVKGGYTPHYTTGFHEAEIEAEGC